MFTLPLCHTHISCHCYIAQNGSMPSSMKTPLTTKYVFPGAHELSNPNVASLTKQVSPALLPTLALCAEILLPAEVDAQMVDVVQNMLISGWNPAKIERWHVYAAWIIQLRGSSPSPANVHMFLKERSNA